MNLRILKKLSKRAAPLLPLLGDNRQQFPAERGDGHTSTTGHDRKHWLRMRSIHGEEFPGTIKYKPRQGAHWIAMREPWDALKGTPMVGAMEGYYEPEWSEETAWEALLDIVWWEYVICDEDGPIPLRRFDTPTKVLATAYEMIAHRAAAAIAQGEKGGAA